jgi:hypothetical protein
LGKRRSLKRKLLTSSIAPINDFSSLGIIIFPDMEKFVIELESLLSLSAAAVALAA